MMTINTLYELVRNSVEKFASKVAFSMYEGDDVTYAEVDRRIARVQEILTGAGLRAGDKVALLSSNMPNWGISYFAVTSAGMVAVPILPDFSGEELDMIIEHSEAKALLVSDKLFTKLSKQTIERLNVAVRTKNLGVISQRVRGEGSTGVPRPDDLAVIIYTSGTTSKPKGVMLTHAALCAQVDISGRARSWPARRVRWWAISRIPRLRRRLSRPTDGSARATSGSWTRTAGSTSRAV